MSDSSVLPLLMVSTDSSVLPPFLQLRMNVFAFDSYALQGIFCFTNCILCYFKLIKNLYILLHTADNSKYSFLYFDSFYRVSIVFSNIIWQFIK